MKRAYGGGHSAPKEKLEEIYAGGKATFRTALSLCGSILNSITVYDNTVYGRKAQRIYRVLATGGALDIKVFTSVPEFLIEDLLDLLRAN